MYARIGVTLRTFLMLGVISLPLVAVGISILFYFTLKTERELLAIRIATTSVRLAHAVQPIVASENQVALNALLSAFAGSPEVRCVSLKLAQDNESIYWPDAGCADRNPDTILHRQPIRQGLVVTGVVDIHYSENAIWIEMLVVVKEVVFGIAVLAFIFLGFAWFTQSVVIAGPIRRILGAMRRVRNGKYDTRIVNKETASPEWRAISRSFNVMVGDLEEKTKKLAAQAHELEEKNSEIFQSLNYAAMIQSQLVALDDPSGFGIDIHGFLQQLGEIGGDYYVGLNLGQRYLLFFADATGHGVPGAMATMILSSAVRDASVRLPYAAAGELMAQIHRSLVNSLGGHPDDSREVSLGADAVLMIFNKTDGSFSYASAKQPFYHIRPEGAERLKADRDSLGYESSPKLFSARNGELAEGEALVLFSDGITDTLGGYKGLAIGRKRLGACLVEALNRGESCAEMAATVVENLRSYSNDKGRVDDRALVVIKRI